MHPNAVFIVVIHLAEQVHGLLYRVNSKGPGVLRQELFAVFSVKHPAAVQLSHIDAGLHAQLGAFAHRHGNTLICCTGNCRAGPQPGIRCEGTRLPLRQGGREQPCQQHQAEQQGKGLFPSGFHHRPPCCVSSYHGIRIREATLPVSA